MGEIFYPDKSNNNGIGKMQQMINTGLPVFARDLDLTFNKEYFACDWETFVENYEKMAVKNIHEVLRGDVPIKFFLDVETTIGTREENDKILESIIDRTLSTMESGFGYKPRYFVMDSSKMSKYSKHVVFRMFFADVSMLSQVFDKIGFDEHELAILDSAVYKKKGCFRILYSSKFGEKRPLVMDHGERGFNKQDLFDTLLTWYVAEGSPTCGEYTKGYSENAFTIYRSENSIESGLGGSSIYGSVPPKVREYLEEKLGGKIVHKTIKKHKDGKQSYHLIVKGLRCPFQDRPHKSNNAFFNIATNNIGYFVCTDTNCQSVPYYDFNCTYLLE